MTEISAIDTYLKDVGDSSPILSPFNSTVWLLPIEQFILDGGGLHV